MFPKIQCGRRGLPDEMADAIYRDYQMSRSLRVTARKFGRSNQALHEMFKRRGLVMFSKLQKQCIEHSGHKFTPGKGGYFRATAGDRKPLHHVIWEGVNGPVPSGMAIGFKDGDKTNFKIENLECAPMAELIKSRSSGENQHTVKRRAHRVEANMGWVVKKAQYFAQRFGVEMEDLIQEGRIALAEADQSYDPKRGANFLTHATFKIRARMQKFVGRFSTGVGRCYTSLVEARKECSTVSLHKPFGDEDSGSLEDLLGVAESVTGDADREDVRDVVAAALETLTPTERRTVEILFFEGKSMYDAAPELGLTRGGVWMRFETIKKKLRKRLKELKEAA